jgi:hypothetical protein
VAGKISSTIEIAAKQESQKGGLDMRYYLNFFLALLVILVSGCASVLGETTQVVSVDTPSCSKAICTLTNDEGIYYIKSTPGTISLNKSYNDLTIVCEKGDERATSIHPSSANGAIWGNIILGGGIGALVDGSRGSGFDYPAFLTNPISCEKVEAPSIPPALESSSYAKRFKRLDDLFKQELITKPEYERKRQKILNSL